MNWFEQADFWYRFYDWMFPADSFEQAEAEIDNIKKLLGRTSGTVLDLCCGPGRYSVPLKKAGFEITGVDLQPFLLGKAREYASRQNATIELVEEDMRNFKRAQAFDMVLNMYSSFGYFSDFEEDLRVLENAYFSLKPGGQILLELRGKEVHAMRFTETVSSAMANGDLVFHRTKTNDDWTRSITTWVYVRGQQVETWEVVLNLYSGAELRNLLEAVGFTEVRLYGHLKGSPYNHTAQRLVAVAKKQ
ncbi:MAG: methyltransferase domain-containing protein [Xenococcaceae cyanobacterium MO_234.B1]|nr:methyltransferase domain-containing protein [Xenococcaceae cyanobacterium MO_234.B1]